MSYLSTVGHGLRNRICAYRAAQFLPTTQVVWVLAVYLIELQRKGSLQIEVFILALLVRPIDLLCQEIELSNRLFRLVVGEFGEATEVVPQNGLYFWLARTTMGDAVTQTLPWTTF